MQEWAAEIVEMHKRVQAQMDAGINPLDIPERKEYHIMLNYYVKTASILEKLSNANHKNKQPKW